MFLKHLEIFGFKSFSERTRIDFSEGITALLGPNGCGKSNVVDAVKWVVGEQSARTLRAEKMEDIIFNGTETRKPLHVAEVSLVISNETGLLNMAQSEVEIKRRLYRSGESEYFINSKQSRLRDVRELFWDTGVGKTAYSVMEQGKIDQILSSKPEDRRYLFEEAAGITRFKVKRAEAERKLAKTEENMQRIDVVLTEVRRAYETLEAQSKKTIQYRELKEAIFNHELDIQLLRLKRFVDEQHSCDEKLKEIRILRDSQVAEIEAVTELLSENMDEVNSLETELTDLQRKIFGLEIERRGKEEQIGLLTERLHELRSGLTRLEMRQAGVVHRIETLQEDADEQHAAVLDFQKQIREVQANIENFEEQINRSGDKISENIGVVDRLTAEIEGHTQHAADMNVQLRSLTEDIVTELDTRLGQAGFTAQTRSEAERAVFDLLAQIGVIVRGRKNLFSDFADLRQFGKEETEKFARNAADSFSELLDLIEKLQSAVTHYKSTSMSFIDEFLAPEGIITKKRRIDEQIELNRNKIDEKRRLITDLHSENAALSAKLDEYRRTLQELRINKTQMDTRCEAAESQTRRIVREITVQENSLREIEDEIFTEGKRIEETTEQINDFEEDAAEIQQQGQALTKIIIDVEQKIQARNTDLSGKRESLQKKKSILEKTQQQLEQYDRRSVQFDVEIRNIKENFREVYARDLIEFEQRMYTITSSATDLRAELSDLKRRHKDLGSVNLMAVEEFQEAKERYEFLHSQKTDLEKARNDLRRITDEITAESTEFFLATYNKIKKNFHNMFRRLFGGGRAEIRLVNPKNVLESGIDIFAQPPGKKLENIGLLSGGEKSMTAVALLFATYMVKPSPFCLLDEIDAALDEQNVGRFVAILREFAHISQYIIITHNKKTVLGANTMLGVTMEESGVSKVIAIKLDNTTQAIQEADSIEAEEFVEEEVPPEEGVYIPSHPPKRIRRHSDGEEHNGE